MVNFGLESTKKHFYALFKMKAQGNEMGEDIKDWKFEFRLNLVGWKSICANGFTKICPPWLEKLPNRKFRFEIKE